VTQRQINDEKQLWGGGIFLPLFFLGFGLLSFIAPENMLKWVDSSNLPNANRFSYALGIICCGVAILFHGHEYWKPKGFPIVAKSLITVGAALFLAGWVYVLWSIGLPT